MDPPRLTYKGQPVKVFQAPESCRHFDSLIHKNRSGGISSIRSTFFRTAGRSSRFFWGPQQCNNSPHANSFIIGTAVTNTQIGIVGKPECREEGGGFICIQ